MRFLALLCLVGFAAASQHSLFKPGTHYTFKYEGRMLSGLPELATHYSGFGIKCNVHVQLEQENEYRIRITDGKFSKVNQELQAEGTDLSKNWRMIGLPQYVPFPAQTSKHLSEPTILKLKSGSKKFESLLVSSEEPEWSVNFKKALAVLFNVRTVEPYSSISQENMLETPESGSFESESMGDSTLTYWKSQEESLEGLCEVTYQVNELPNYMVRENKYRIAPLIRACGSSEPKFFEIVRSRDVATCTMRSAAFHFHKPGFMRCRTGNCEGQATRSSITRYAACGSSRQDMRIQSIVNEGEVEVDVLGFHSEKFVTGNKQNLTLVEQRPLSSSSKIGTPSSPLEKKSLVYEYSDSSSSSTYTSLLPSVTSKITGKKIPESISGIKLNYLGKDVSFNPHNLVQEMIQEITHIVQHELFKNQQQDKELPIKVLKLSRGFSVLKKEEIQEIYDHLKNRFNDQEDKETMRNIFFDTLMMGGTRPCVEFFKEKVMSNEVSDLQTASLFTFMPNYVVVPNEELLESIFELVTSSQVRQRSDVVYHQGILGLTSLVHKVCVAENRLVSYPVRVYGELCYPDSDVVVSKLIPYLQEQLSRVSSPEERSMIIIALGSLSHKNTLQILLPYVQGTPLSSSSSNGLNAEDLRMERMLALYSTAQVGKRYPGLVEPALFAVLSNQVEATELRISAFNALLALNPSETYLHRVASLTWREKDEQVLRVIESAFYSLSTNKDVEPLSPTYTSLARKAYIVYPLIRKPSSMFPSSVTFVNTDYLKELGVTYEEDFSWTSTAESYVPVNFYHKLRYLMNRYQYTFFEYAQRIRGGENLIQNLVEILTPNERHMSRDQYAEKIKSRDLSSEWKEVIEKLKLKVKQTNKGEAQVFLNLFETAPIFKTFTSSSNPNSLKQQISKFLKKDLTKESFCGHHKVNVQRVTNLQSWITSIPNDMGFPFILENHMPQILSLKGHLNIDCQGSNRFIPKFEVKVQQLYESSKVGYVGTILPFTEEFITTGVEQTGVVNFPVEFDIVTDPNNQMVKAKITTISSQQQPIDMLYYQLRPFTVAQKLDELKPYSQSNQFKTIRSPTQVKEKQFTFGQEYLGLNLVAGLKTESRFVDFRSIFEKLQMFNYNPLNILRFNWVSTAMSEKRTPSVRFHKVHLTYDPSSSQTKEIDFQLKWGSATKLKGDQNIKYNMLKFSDSFTDSYPEWKKIIPLKWESKIIEQSPVHPIRERKLKEVIEKSGIQSGYGWLLDFNLSLRGNRARNYHFVMKHASGEEEFLKQKWHLELESPNGSSNKFCVTGHMRLPRSPLWKIHEIRSSNLQFDYLNVFGYGRDCTEHKVQIQGTSRVSEKQKEYSSKSPEFRTYQRMMERRLPLADMSLVAEKVRVQASNFDEAEFTVKYENATPKVMSIGKYFSEYVKSFLWPYLVVNTPTGSSSSSSLSGNMINNWRFRYNERSNTVDVTLHKQDETIVFKNIRLPGVFSHFLPSNAVKMMEKSQNSYSKIYPTCKLEGRWLRTFNNETTEAKMDECFHVLAADCSYRKSFGILARNVSSSRDSAKELKVYVGKTTIMFTPSNLHSSYSNDVNVRVNGSEISNLKTVRHYTIKDSKQDYVADLYLSQDGVITLKFLHCSIMQGPSVIVKFDGFKTEVKVSPMYRSKMCGLCGDLSGLQLTGMVGPERCTYSKPELLTASYRVPLSSKSCPSLPSRIESELSREKSECLRVREVPTKVYKSFEAQVGPCSRHTHEVVEEVTRFCFSRVPVPSCSSLCRATQKTQKRISFACMPKGRVAERYAEKIRRGEILPELEHMSEAFGTTLTLPRSCVKA